MYREHPIVCPHCKKDTGMTEEQFMYAYIDHDLLCPQCGQVVIAENKMGWTTNEIPKDHWTNRASNKNIDIH